MALSTYLCFLDTGVSIHAGFSGFMRTCKNAHFHLSRFVLFFSSVLGMARVSSVVCRYNFEALWKLGLELFSFEVFVERG